MRASDLHPALRDHLAPCTEHPHVKALVAPPTPRRLTASAQVAGDLARAEQALRSVSSVAGLLPNAEMLTRSLVRREAVQSSQIEGTRTQLDELLEYEATAGQDASGPVAADRQITERYVQALEEGRRRIQQAGGSRSALSNALLLDLHAILMQDTPGAAPGCYRTQQAWIGQGRIEDAVFVPAPPEHVPRCMDDFERSILQYAPAEDEPFALSVVAQLAIAHVQFETVHPFADGNGRLGRLLLPLILDAEGLPPLYLAGTLLEYRSAYYEALQQAQLRCNWDPWVRLLSKAVVDACEEMVVLAKDLDQLRLTWETRLADLRADATARKLPRFLLGHPIVSVRQVADAFGISFVAANRAIDQLVSRQILMELTQRRNRVFIAVAVVSKMQRR
jgi:Fic family protein